MSYDDRLEDKRKNYQNCSVLCCARQLYTMIFTQMSSSERRVLIFRLRYSFCVFFWFRLDYFVLVMLAFVVLGLTKPRDWLGITSLKWH